MVENGSTDGTRKIVQKLAQRDSRIKLQLREQNHLITGETPPPLYAFVYSLSEAFDGYITYVDADDWWEPDYLERLVTLAEENELDIACTGMCSHIMATGKVEVAKPQQRRVYYTRKEFLENFADCHVHFGPYWGKLIRINIAKKAGIPPELACSADTIWCYSLLRHAERIGIDDSAMYHYRIHRKSVSNHYVPARFDSDAYVYNAYIDLVSEASSVSQKNRDCIDKYYSYLVNRTLQLVHDAQQVPPEEKLREYRRIAEHDTMRNTYIQNMLDCRKLRILLLQCAFAAKCGIEGESTDFAAVLDVVEPYCSDLDDDVFLSEQIEICRLLERGESAKTLGQMTSILQTREKLYSTKIFVSAYITLAEREKKADLVGYGMQKLAEFYLKRNDAAKCRALLAELVPEEQNKMLAQTIYKPKPFLDGQTT